MGEVEDYIRTFYNPVRRHSSLDYLSPIDYEVAAARLCAAGVNNLSTKAGEHHS